MAKVKKSKPVEYYYDSPNPTRVWLWSLIFIFACVGGVLVLIALGLYFADNENAQADQTRLALERSQTAFIKTLATRPPQIAQPTSFGTLTPTPTLGPSFTVLPSDTPLPETMITAITSTPLPITTLQQIRGINWTGTHILVSSACGVRVHNRNLLGRAPVLLPIPNSAAFDVAVNQDRIAVAGGDGLVKLWNMGDVQAVENEPNPAVAPEQNLSGHNFPVWSVAFSPNGAQLISGGDDGTVRIWQNGSQIDEISGGRGAVWTVTFSPDGRQIVSGGFDGVVRVWDATTRELVGEFGDSSSQIFDLVFHPFGTVLAVGRDNGSIELWDIRSFAQLATLEGHTTVIRSLAFNSDGSVLASGSDDRTVRLWDVASRQQRGLLDHPDPVAGVVFSPDDSTLATVMEDGTLTLWNLQTQVTERRLEGC